MMIDWLIIDDDDDDDDDNDDAVAYTMVVPWLAQHNWCLLQAGVRYLLFYVGLCCKYSWLICLQTLLELLI